MPMLFPQKESIYSYFWLNKKGYTTFEAIEYLTKYFNVPQGDIAAAGLKDEDGVTSQLMSIKKIIFPNEIDQKNISTDQEKYFIINGISGYGKEPIIPRILHGNSFRLKIRNLTVPSAEKIFNYCKENRFISFLNYYDSQRFGMPLGPYNTHLIGKAIVENNWQKALVEYSLSGNNPNNTQIKLPVNERDCQELFVSMASLKIDFFISSYESMLWNNAVSDFLNQNCSSVEVDFPNVGRLSIASPEKDLPILFSTQGYSYDKQTQAISSKLKTRNMVVTSTVYPIEITDDQYNSGMKAIELSFFLPTGCYATMLVKQLIIKATNGK
jgi:tRNA pseudouridine13 synthase